VFVSPHKSAHTQPGGLNTHNVWQALTEN